MRQLYTCVTQQHDLGLVALAAAICALGCHSTFALNRQASRCQETRERLRWAAGCVLVTSTAIWATHFIGMLAFKPGLPSGFDVATTAASFVAAVVLVGLGQGIAAGWPGPRGRLIGGVVIGLAVSVMHYTGMAAYSVQGHLAWDAPGVVASVVTGATFGALAMVLAPSERRFVRVLALLALLLAVCGAHFLGMGAVAVAFDPAVAVPPSTMDDKVLSILTANAAFVVLLMSAAAVRLWVMNRRRLEAEDKRLRDLADIAVEGLVICDGPLISGVNRSLERMLGQTRETVTGSSLQRLLPDLCANTIPTAHELDAVLRLGSGDDIPVRVIAQVIAINAKPHTVVAVRDQRDRLRSERELHHLAHHDTLTGLANRRQFNDALAGHLAARRALDAPFALLALDLDRFKLVNDTLGHGMGDDLLRRVANRLVRAVRTDDMVARLGGDEFAILKAGEAGLADVQALAERLIDMLARPFLIDGQLLNIGASVGIALAPGDGQTPEQLLCNADLALYGAKADGRGRFRFFENSMNARVQERRSLELDLRRALARHEFELHFQPQVDARTGTFDGAEALVRWRHPERGLVSPAEFIPLAEETGLIGQLGEWVLRTACHEAMGWPGHLTVAVNVSPVQIRNTRLGALVRGILAETGLPGGRLEVEITEGALLSHEERTLETLHELRGLGVRISMDDFGTGYSSLSYLRRFPFDKIKIDQSFVRQTPHDKDSAAIVRAIATLGASLGMRTTAEGVETSAQASFIAGEGCSQIQGYLYGRPVPADALLALFAPPVAALA